MMHGMEPWNIAHRGGAHLRAENTLCAFAHAVKLGCDGAELDVQLSRDGEVIVHHDPRLNPELCRDIRKKWLTAPAARIKDLTYFDLGVLDVGRADPASDYAREHLGVVWQDDESIPLLAEVIAVAKTARVPFRLFVEMKTSFTNREDSASPEELARRTLAVIQEHDHLDRCIFVGFDWTALLHLKRIAPEAACWFSTMPRSWFSDGAPPREHDPPPQPALQILRAWARAANSPWAGGYDAVKHGGSLITAAKAAGADGWFPMQADVDAQTVAEARSFGLKIGAWTVNDATEIRRLASLGIDAICTDRPDVMAEALCKSWHAPED
jgi:glycerophosphoryl diester phosphodiesterase